MKKIITIFLISFCMLLFFSTSTSPLYENYYEDDSAIFILIGKAIVNGSVPYRDIFDHKGPILFWIQALGQLLWEGRNGIFIIQILMLTITNIILYKIASYFCNKKHAIISVIVSMGIFSLFIEEGNLSEELSLPFLAACLYIAINLVKENQLFGKHVVKYAFIYGINFAIISLIRLNNAAIICGLVLGFIILFIKNRYYKKMFQCAGMFVLGIVMVYLPVIKYFQNEFALSEMIYGTFIHNFRYLQIEGNLIAKICYGMHIPVFVILTYKIIKKESNLNVLLLSSSIFTYIVLLLGQEFAHYYAISIPLVPVYIACILQICEQENKKVEKFIIYLILVFICIFYSILSIINCVGYLYNQKNVTLEESKKLIDAIPEEERGAVYLYEHNFGASICLYGDIIPCNKYVFYHRKIINVSPEKYNEIYEEISSEDVGWIISKNVENFTTKNGIDNYILNNYIVVGNMTVTRQEFDGLVDEEIFLYKKLDNIDIE